MVGSVLKSMLGAAGTTNESVRRDWIAGALAQVEPGLRLLDAGAGEKQFRALCSHLDYVSQDFARYEPAEDASGLHPGSWSNEGLDIVSDITAIPEASASFDAVLCTEVLEHLPHPVKALEEFARLLRPGGVAIITAPFCSMTHFAPYHFSTGFSRYFYERVLPELGFEVIEITPNGNYFEYLAQELRRLPSVAERYSDSGPSNASKVAIGILLRTLERLSRTDTGSSELLTYGLHVRARRA